MPEARPIICKVCDRGTLRKKDIFRMSGPVVVIGFILLIPSMIGMALSAVGIYIMMSSAEWKDTSQSGMAGMAIGFLITLAAGVVCFAGGLLGWLLIMQRRVLQCPECRAVINAS